MEIYRVWGTGVGIFGCILFSLVAWMQISRFPGNFLAAESEIFGVAKWMRKRAGESGERWAVVSGNRKHFNSLQIYSLRSPERTARSAGHFLFIAKRVARHFHDRTGMKLDILEGCYFCRRRRRFFFRLRLQFSFFLASSFFFAFFSHFFWSRLVFCWPAQKSGATFVAALRCDALAASSGFYGSSFLAPSIAFLPPFATPLFSAPPSAPSQTHRSEKRLLMRQRDEMKQTKATSAQSKKCRLLLSLSSSLYFPLSLHAFSLSQNGACAYVCVPGWMKTKIKGGWRTGSAGRKIAKPNK